MFDYNKFCMPIINQRNTSVLYPFDMLPGTRIEDYEKMRIVLNVYLLQEAAQVREKQLSLVWTTIMPQLPPPPAQ